MKMKNTHYLSNLEKISTKERRITFKEIPEGKAREAVSTALTGKNDSIKGTEGADKWESANFAVNDKATTFMGSAKKWLKEDHTPAFKAQLRATLKSLKTTYDKIPWKATMKASDLTAFRTKLTAALAKAKVQAKISKATKKIEKAKAAITKDAVEKQMNAWLKKVPALKGLPGPVQAIAIQSLIKNYAGSIHAAIHKGLDAAATGLKATGLDFATVTKIYNTAAKYQAGAKKIMENLANVDAVKPLVGRVKKYISVVKSVLKATNDCWQKGSLSNKIGSNKCKAVYKTIVKKLGGLLNKKSLPADIVKQIKSRESELIGAAIFDSLGAQKAILLAKLKAGGVVSASLKKLTLSAFMTAMAQLRCPFKDFESKSAKSEAIKDAIKIIHGLVGKLPGVKMKIEGGANSTSIRPGKVRKIKELRTFAAKIKGLTGANKTTIEKIPQVKEHLVAIKELANTPDGPKFKALMIKMKRDNAKWLGGGGVINTLIALRRAQSISGDIGDGKALFYKGNCTVVTRAAKTGGDKIKDRYSRISFSLGIKAKVGTPATGTPGTPGRRPAARTGLGKLPGRIKTTIGTLQKSAAAALKLIGTFSNDPKVKTAAAGLRTALSDLGKLITPAELAKLTTPAAIAGYVTGKLVPAFAKVRIAVAKLVAAIKKAKEAKDNVSKRAKLDLTKMEVGREYVDAYGNKYKMDKNHNLHYEYSGNWNRLRKGKQHAKPIEALKILTGRRYPTEGDAKAIIARQMPGVDLSGTKIDLAYDSSSKELTITLSKPGSSGTDPVEFVHDFKDGNFTVPTGKDKITPYLATAPKAATDKQKGALLSKGFRIDSASLNTATDQVNKWLTASPKQYLKALVGDGPTKPGILNLAGTALNSQFTVNDLAEVYNDSAAAVFKKANVKLSVPLFKKLLPLIKDIDSDYDRIKTYLPDLNDRLGAVIALSDKKKIALDTIKSDLIHATCTEATLVKFIAAISKNYSDWESELGNYSADKDLIDKIVITLLKTKKPLPAFLLAKFTELIDFIALKGKSSIGGLNEAGIKAKMKTLIDAVITGDGAMPTQANLDQIYKDLFGDDWKTGPKASGKHKAAHDALTGGTLDLVNIWNSNLTSTQHTEYFATLMSRKAMNIGKIDIPKIKANKAVEAEIVKVLKPLSKTHALAGELLVKLVGERAPSGTAEITARRATLKLEYNKMKDRSNPPEARLAIAKKLKATTTAINVDDKKIITGTANATEFDKRVKTETAVAQYDLAIKGKGGRTNYDDIDFDDTHISATDQMRVFAGEYGNVVLDIAVDASFLKKLKSGKYQPVQLEQIMYIAGDLVGGKSYLTEHPEDYIKLALATGLLGVAEDQIKTTFSGEAHTMHLWLSKLKTNPDQKKAELTKAYLALPNPTSPDEDTEVLDVIEACLKAGLKTIQKPGGAGTINIDRDPTKIRVIAAKTAGTPPIPTPTAVRAMALIYQFGLNQSAAATPGMSKGKMILALAPAAASADYKLLEKAVVGGAAGLQLTDLTTPNQKEAYATILHALATRAPAKAKYKTAFIKLPKTWIPTGAVKTKYDELRAKAVLSGTLTSTKAEYVNAVKDAPDATVAQILKAIGHFATLTPGTPNFATLLTAFIAKSSVDTDSNKVKIYTAAGSHMGKGGLTFANTFKKGIDLAEATDVGRNSCKALIKASKRKSPGNNSLLLTQLVANDHYIKFRDIAVLGLSMINNSTIPNTTNDITKIWQKYFAKYGATNTLIKGKPNGLARKLAMGANTARKAALKAITTASVKQEIYNVFAANATAAEKAIVDPYLK